MSINTPVQQCPPEGTTLRDEGNVSPDRVCLHGSRVQVEMGPDEPQAIGAKEFHLVLLLKLNHPPLKLLTLGACLFKSWRNNNQPLHSRLAAFFHK